MAHEAFRLFSFSTFCSVLFIYELLHNLGLRMVKNQCRKYLTIHFDHIKGFPKLNLNMQESLMMLTRSNDYAFFKQSTKQQVLLAFNIIH